MIQNIKIVDPGFVCCRRYYYYSRHSSLCQHTNHWTEDYDIKYADHVPTRQDTRKTE